MEARPFPIASHNTSDVWRGSSWQYGRQQTPVLGSMYGQHDAKHTSPTPLREHWHGLPSDKFDRRASATSRIGDEPLSLYIPASKGMFVRCASAFNGFPFLPLRMRSNTSGTATDSARTLPAYGNLVDDINSSTSGRRKSTLPFLAGTSQNNTTSLPSFASLQESANRIDEAGEGPEIASMSERMSCGLCSKLRPMVEDIAIAVAELDETVQTSCSRSVTRVRARPRASNLSSELLHI